MYIYDSNNLDLLENIEKYVYQVIAIQNKKNVQNIKTNIVKACELAYLYQNKEVIKKYFLMDIKPTPKLVMKKILDKIKEQEE